MPSTELNCTLLSDGSSDKALIPILRWLLCRYLPNRPVQLRWADLRQLPHPPREPHERIAKSEQLYPCDLLFVHRDAESISIDDRRTEIHQALNRAGAMAPGIAVIPVRMMEAWLLIDEVAIRKAAGNPNGSMQLNLPRLRDIESITNPKNTLHDLILEATGFLGRRRKKFERLDLHSAVQRIPEYTEDFSPLCQLSAFQMLEQQVSGTISGQAWGA